MKKTRLFTDIDLVFDKNPINGDVNVVYDEVAIKRSLKNLIFMNMYDSPFHPEISSPIGSLLFQTFTPDLANVLQRILLNLIANFEPRVRVLEINITTTPQLHQLDCEIVFTIINSQSQIVFNVLLQRVR